MFSGNDNWGTLLLGIGAVCLFFPAFFGIVAGIAVVLAIKFVIFESLKSMS